MQFTKRDIISINDFTKEEILHVLKTAEKLKKKPMPHLLDGCVMASCFFEPSTRTRLSFESAMQGLGGRVVGFADPSVTSIKKGETLYDTARVIGQYVHVLVIRHPDDGAARRAAEATDTPVVNGGDGANQHPTQALLDLFTIKECQKDLDGLHIAFMGDMKYGRGIHSLVQSLKHFNVRLYFVAPPSVQLPSAYVDELKQNQIKFSFHEDIGPIMSKIDILYLTRMQEERFPDRLEYERIKHAFFLTPSMLHSAKPSMRILHIMPRVCEMDTVIDNLPHAYYFEQAGNGYYLRQAVLGLVLGKL